jgi:outer membrane lipoprotein SlyB
MRMPHALSLRTASLLALVLFVSGCAAATTAIGKRDLDVQTRMTNTIFLDPVAPDRRTVYVQVRNTSDRPDFDIADHVRAAVAARGYTVVEDPDQAQFLLQANVLQVGVTSPTAAERTFGGGFGSAAVGGAVGAGVGRVISRDTGTIIAGALIGAAAETVTGSFFKDVTYSITTDLQVSERTRQGVVVTEELRQSLEEGAAGRRTLSASETSDWKRYRTRVMSTANKVNLEFEEAAPQLVDGLTRSIAGIL